jgi:hypothetical protein
MVPEFLRISPRITAFPVIHGSGDFSVEVRRLMLAERFDCVAVPLPPSFQPDTERAIGHLPGISIVLQEELPNYQVSDWSPERDSAAPDDAERT